MSCNDLLFQSSRVRRPKRALATYHLVEHYTDGPKAIRAVYVTGLQSFGRQIRKASKIIPGDLAAQGQRFRNPKVENLRLAV
jgi:hypothetical protein